MGVSDSSNDGGLGNSFAPQNKMTSLVLLRSPSFLFKPGAIKRGSAPAMPVRLAAPSRVDSLLLHVGGVWTETP